MRGWPPVTLRLFPILATLVLCAGLAPGQTRFANLGDSVRLINSDQAILASQVERQDLPCKVDPVDPFLGFDLRFHAGYEVEIPLDELAGDGNSLTMLFRVTPDERYRDAVYFVQSFRVPSLEPDAAGKTTLTGIFDIGEGNYHIDWMMRDGSERVCSDYWDAEAKLSGREQEIVMEIAAGAIDESEFTQFREEPPVARATGELLNIKLLVNFAPQDQNSSSLQPIDTLALVTMLRRISREPQFGGFALTAFNMEDQEIVYRQSRASRIDFPALGRAISQIEPGTVDFSLLAEKNSETDFLRGLILSEMDTAYDEQDRPDAIIFAGPKHLLDERIRDEDLEVLVERVDFPVFYLNYNLIPSQVPWRDAIGRAIRVFGGEEYTVTQPKDLYFAIAEMVSRIVESSSREATPTAPQ